MRRFKYYDLQSFGIHAGNHEDQIIFFFCFKLTKRSTFIYIYLKFETGEKLSLDNLVISVLAVSFFFVKFF